jgi:hypothetical protein
MSRSDILAWLGIILGIPGLLIALFSDAVIVAVIFLILCGVLFWVRWWLNQPLYTLACVEKVLTIEDTVGNKARLVRFHEGVANHRGLQEFWCRNISADGTISNVLIDNHAPDYTERRAGDLQVGTRFREPLERGEKFKMVLSYDLTDSFLRTPEALIHVTESKTKKLKMVVILPPDRPATNALATLSFGGQPHRRLVPPRLTGQVTGERIELEIKAPKLGAEYRLEWNW